jgi:hypothetical protein
MKKFNVKKRAAQSTRGVQLSFSFSFSSVVKCVRGRREHQEGHGSMMREP